MEKVYFEIGEMVSPDFIQSMNDFIDKHGEDMFRSCVYAGSFEEAAFAYIHPNPRMKETKRFEIIQSAFIRAYV